MKAKKKKKCLSLLTLMKLERCSSKRSSGGGEGEGEVTFVWLCKSLMVKIIEKYSNVTSAAVSIFEL